MRLKRLFILVISILFLTVPTVVFAEVEITATTTKIKVGESTTLTATNIPEGYSVKSWTSAQPEVATVSNGTVTAVAKGTATITLTIVNDADENDTQTATKAIEVEEEEQQPQQQESITLNKAELTLEVNGTETLKATVTPDESNVTWDSNNKSVAVVDSTGKVTAISKGTATITATNGTKTATCKVTVNESTPKAEDDISVKITGATITPTFSKDVYSYDLKITDVNSFKIDTNGSIAPSDYKNADTITIIYGDGENAKSYRLNVVKEKKEEEIEKPTAYLSKLSILGYNFNEVFDKENGNGDYKITVGYDVTSVTIEAVAEGANYSVTCGSKKLTNTKTTGNTTQFTISDLDIGGTQVVITVTNGTATFKYYVYIERNDKEEEEKKDTPTDDKKKDDKTDDSEFDIPDVEDPDTALNMVTVSLASISLFTMGTLGIYFYMSTSPKRMKKEIVWNNKNKREAQSQSPIVEVISSMAEDKEPTKEYRKE